MTDIRTLPFHSRSVPNKSQSFAEFTAQQNAAGEYRLSEILKAWRELHFHWQRAA